MEKEIALSQKKVTDEKHNKLNEEIKNIKADIQKLKDNQKNAHLLIEQTFDSLSNAINAFNQQMTALKQIQKAMKNYKIEYNKRMHESSVDKMTRKTDKTTMTKNVISDQDIDIMQVLFDDNHNTNDNNTENILDTQVTQPKPKQQVVLQPKRNSITIGSISLAMVVPLAPTINIDDDAVKC